MPVNKKYNVPRTGETIERLPWENRLNYVLNMVLIGNGSPEGVVEANVGTLFLRMDGSAGTTLYVKQSGTGSTGWGAIGPFVPEEGTFTPVVIGATSAGTGTYSVQIGRYSKIGKRVFYQLRVDWSAHSGTGQMTVGGLPYTSLNVVSAHAATAVWLSDITFAAGAFAEGFVNHNSTQIFLYYTSSGATWTGIPMDASGVLILSGSYEAA